VRLRPIPILLLSAACAGGNAGPAVSSSPEATVKAFLAAARDTNVTLMANYWGGPSGPASQTRQPPDYEKRVRIMQVYLANDSVRVSSLGTVDGHPEQAMVTVLIFRGKCRNSVPFVAGKWKNLWLIQNVDLSSAGNPAKQCDAQGNPI